MKHSEYIDAMICFSYTYEDGVFKLRQYKASGVDIHIPNALMLACIGSRDLGTAYWHRAKPDEYQRALDVLDAEGQIE